MLLFLCLLRAAYAAQLPFYTGWGLPPTADAYPVTSIESFFLVILVLARHSKSISWLVGGVASMSVHVLVCSSCCVSR